MNANDLDLTGWHLHSTEPEDTCWICGAAYGDCDCPSEPLEPAAGAVRRVEVIDG